MLQSSTDSPDHTVQNHPRSDLVSADCVRLWPNGSTIPSQSGYIQTGSGMFTGLLFTSKGAEMVGTWLLTCRRLGWRWWWRWGWWWRWAHRPHLPRPGPGPWGGGTRRLATRRGDRGLAGGRRGHAGDVVLLDELLPGLEGLAEWVVVLHTADTAHACKTTFTKKCTQTSHHTACVTLLLHCKGNAHT